MDAILEGYIPMFQDKEEKVPISNKLPSLRCREKKWPTALRLGDAVNCQLERVSWRFEISKRTHIL